MPKCTNKKLDFGRLGRRVIEADFDGGDLSSEAGVLLLRRMDQRLGLCSSAARALGDERQRGKVRHSLASMLAQRVYGLCQGWSDVSDHNALRSDLAMQTAVGRDEALASAPTLSRLETAATPAQAWALHGVLLDQFPRNMYRASPMAFATDWIARQEARLALEGGADKLVDYGRRHFFYMPFEHSEDLADQDLSVSLFEAHGDEMYLDYAVRHRDVIADYGRFPHRNALLGRTSTPEELAYLAAGGFAG